MQTLEETLTVTMNNQLKKMAAHYVMSDIQNLDKLWILITERPYPICSRAAWTFEYICSENSKILENWSEKIAAYFPHIPHNSVRRIMAKLLSQTPIPEAYEGYVLNTAFEWLANPKIPIAVRANCMKIIYNLYQKYPEIAPELEAIIQNQLAYASAGIKNRGLKILKKIK